MDTIFVLAVAASISLARAAQEHPTFILCCNAGNDLYAVLRGSGIACERFDDPLTALGRAQAGDGVLLLADGYPGSTTAFSEQLLRQAASKNIRLYVEYPAWLPGGPAGAPRESRFERAVVQSGLFGEALPPLRILSIGGMRFVPATGATAHLVAARVAGFDSAVYGLPEARDPLLFEDPAEPGLMVATTRLSGFVRGRYAPVDAWKTVWRSILGWLAPGVTLPPLTWKPTVRPSYGPADPLPPDAERQAFGRGVAWFRKSHLLLHPSRRAEAYAAIAGGQLLSMPRSGAPVGDGSLGIMEGILSSLEPNGSQRQSPALRGDCNGESAMALAFGGALLRDTRSMTTAQHLLDYWYFTAEARKGARADPESSAYGLIAWGVGSPAWSKANYGDDNARLILGTLAASALTRSDRWNEPVMRCLLANLRTSGRFGFRGDRIDLEELAGRSWQEFFARDIVNYSPHMEAYLWACYLWAFDKTRDSLFLQRAETALRMTMAVSPSGWRWMNGLAQERARMLLPLAWLVRVSDTPEHRRWLSTAVQGVLTLQVGCGAIREELGAADKGVMPPPASNEAYGGAEASLIQRNGDPVSDQLYTTNFAFLGLHEAASVGDSLSAQAEEKLAGYFCRTQIRSDAHPELDGGWFRAFDFERWEQWGSNADAGWGAWTVESGWTQAWITSVLGMRQMKTSLWDLTAQSRINAGYGRLREEMLSRK